MARPISPFFIARLCKSSPSLSNSLILRPSQLHSPVWNAFNHSSPFPGINYFSTSNQESNKENFEWRQRVVGAQPAQNLKVGPYKRGRWFVSYKEDPGSFITNILILLVTGYAIFTLLPGTFRPNLSGESMKVRRQRKLRQMLLDKANLTEAELNFIENYKFESENKEQISQPE